MQLIAHPSGASTVRVLCNPWWKGFTEDTFYYEFGCDAVSLGAIRPKGGFVRDTTAQKGKKSPPSMLARFAGSRKLGRCAASQIPWPLIKILPIDLVQRKMYSAKI